MSTSIASAPLPIGGNGASPAAAAAAPARARRALLTPGIDFWLLGGISVAIWAAAYALEGFRGDSWAIDHHFSNFLAMSGSLALVCNYPHFMASYKIAYGRGREFIFKNWFQLLAVPAGLVLCLAIGYAYMLDPTVGKSVGPAIGDALRAVGLQTKIGTAPTFGREMIGMLLNVMYFTVGWHYSKQTYGCMMVMASFEGYKLDLKQRAWLRYSLHLIWAASYVYANVGSGVADFQGVSYASLGLPSWLRWVSIALWGASALGVGYFVIAKNWLARAQHPSANMLIPYIALVVWWIPPFVQRDFFIYIVPFFHSLQYLGFVYKVEKMRAEKRAPSAAERASSPPSPSLALKWRGVALLFGLALTGFLAFEFLPNYADNKLGTFQSMNAWFFFISAHIFINVHHYFIDNVIWRFDHKEVKEYLLG